MQAALELLRKRVDVDADGRGRHRAERGRQAVGLAPVVAEGGEHLVGETAHEVTRADAQAVAAILGRGAGQIEQRWNATPRDTKALQTLLKYLPGGSKLVKWTEASPYLLTLVLVTHGAVFGHLDLIVLGGYGLATWLTERLSNEVTARTRTTNTRIADRFAKIGHDQIERVCAWLERRAPSKKVLEQLERASEEVSEEAVTA